MKITGQCHCGDIAYEATVDPEKVGICHCTDCQALSASAFRTIAVVPAADFRLTRGHPAEYIKTGDSGNPRVQAFCGRCGSGLYATDPGESPKAYNVRLGTADERHALAPRFECWRKSALPWVTKCPGAKSFRAGIS